MTRCIPGLNVLSVGFVPPPLPFPELVQVCLLVGFNPDSNTLSIGSVILSSTLCTAFLTVGTQSIATVLPLVEARDRQNPLAP